MFWTVRRTSPCGVNLKAFPTKFKRTWRNRPGSPRSACGTYGSSGATRCRRLSWAGLIKRLTISCRISGRLKSTISRSSLPASIFEKSRISFRIVRRDSAELLAVVVYSYCSRVRSVSRISSVIPRVPFIGVRISWLMVARNSDLTRLAASAASLDCRSSVSRRLCSVKSTP